MRNVLYTIILLLYSFSTNAQCEMPQVTNWHFYDKTHCVLSFNNPSGVDSVHLEIMSPPPNYYAADTVLVQTFFTLPAVSGANIDTITFDQITYNGQDYSLLDTIERPGFKDAIYFGKLYISCSPVDSSASFNFAFSPSMVENNAYVGVIPPIYINHDPKLFIGNFFNRDFYDSTYIDSSFGQNFSDTLSLKVDLIARCANDFSLSLISPSGQTYSVSPNWHLNNFSECKDYISTILGPTYQVYENAYNSNSINGFISSGGFNYYLKELPVETGYWKIKIHYYNSSRGFFFDWHLYNHYINKCKNPLKSKVFVDLNSDGKYNNNDYPVPYIFVKNLDDNTFYLSNHFGDIVHCTLAPEGNLKTINLPQVFQQQPSVQSYNVSDTVSDRISLSEQIPGPDFKVSITLMSSSPSLNILSYLVNYNNQGSTCNPSEITVHLADSLSFYNCNAVDFSLNGNTITIHTDTICPGASGTVEVLCTAQTSFLQSHQKFTSTVNIENPNDIYEPNNSDSYTTDLDFPRNEFSLNVDRDTIYSNLISNSPLEYTLRFQNPYNQSDLEPIKSIVITQHLDFSQFDLSSFKFMGSSAPVDIKYAEDSLTFIFNSINLPNSLQDYFNSFGFVKYKITPKDNLAPGEIIESNAKIKYQFLFIPAYFDTVKTYIEESNGLHIISISNQIKILPNPTNQYFRISIPKQYVNGHLTILDLKGNLIKNQNVSRTNTEIDIENLTAGIYILHYQKGEFIGNLKLVKY